MPFIPSVLRVKKKNHACYIKCFFCIYWKDNVIFLNSFVNVMNNIYKFIILKHPWNSRINQLGHNILSFLCTAGFRLLLWCLGFFCVFMLLSKIGLWFSFLLLCLLDFGIKVILSSWNGLGSALSFSILCESLYKLERCDIELT